ncbi:MAG: hypothetical protein WCK47_09025 [bacterium]
MAETSLTAAMAQRVEADRKAQKVSKVAADGWDGAVSVPRSAPL